MTLNFENFQILTDEAREWPNNFQESTDFHGLGGCPVQNTRTRGSLFPYNPKTKLVADQEEDTNELGGVFRKRLMHQLGAFCRWH